MTKQATPDVDVEGSNLGIVPVLGTALLPPPIGEDCPNRNGRLVKSMVPVEVRAHGSVQLKMSLR
jgi:hypothetical protein